MTATALWFVEKARAELRPADLSPQAGAARVRTLYSGLSRGTERLVFNGLVPPEEFERMRAPMMEGNFPFPVKYGYAAVGLVEDGPPHLLGRTVFCLHPHQDRFNAPPDAVTLVPEAVPARRAVLAANMETALNAVWDSNAGPGDRIVVVGAGVVGLMIARIAARLPGARVTVVDIDPAREAIATAFGAAFRPATAASDLAATADVVFHASAHAAGLGLALSSAGMEATVVELSWYGAGVTPVALGGAFHSQRLRLISSQVGQLPPARRPRWDYARRKATALMLLDDPVLDALITEEIAFTDLPGALPRLLAPGAPGLQTLICYS
ncbi:MAG: zinc-binding alcohol dehydrogenase [Proteobacteria bacterium]|nr:zinc-binding alcohol dehydrogenase [Pseudomonadota bacterium]